MKGSVIWLGEQECLVETSGQVFSVTDPGLIASISASVKQAAERSGTKPRGFPTAATLATLSDIANVRPHEGLPAAPMGPRGFGRVLARRQVSNLPDVRFAAVLEARRSVREFSAPGEGDLLDLLTYAARTRFSWPANDDQTVSSRPSPSAGGRHPIEIVVAALEVGSLPSGLYWFDPVLWPLGGASGGPR